MGRHRRGRAVPRGLIAGGMTLVMVTLVAVILASAHQPYRVSRPAVAVSPLSISPSPEPDRWPRWGMTHTHYSASDDDPQVARAAREALAAQGMVHNQHIMGFGAGNPEPRPGEFDFSSLDVRVRLMADAAGTPVITLCCAPDWMKGGRPGETDWNLIEVAPRNEHFADFARLAGAVARRYPHVRHFIVWNEFKGLWDAQHGTWNTIAYTELYNQVYDALKAVNPQIKVGGPYLPVVSYAPPGQSAVSGPWGSVDSKVLAAVDYWLRHKRGADFVVVDGGVTTQEGSLLPDEFGALGKFSAMTRWLRERSDLPVWWAEFYPLPCVSLDADGSCMALDWEPQRRTAVTAVALMELAASGAETALYWNPHEPRKECSLCLWSGTDGRPSDILGLLQNFVRWFPQGTRIVSVPVSDPLVRVLAQEHQMVVVNASGVRRQARVDGIELMLEPYEVRWMDRVPQSG